jgi:hypothetical protein
MSSLYEITILVVIAAALAYALDSLRSRERVRDVALAACRRAGVQLLDDTVELVRVRVQRDARGRLALQREYRFEFTIDGDRRRRGWVTLLGRQALHLTMDTELH